MDETVVACVGASIVSPLGIGVQENLEALRQGESRLRRHSGRFGLPENFTASLFEAEEPARLCAERDIHAENLTRFEQLAVLSIDDALRRTDVRPAAEDVLFVLSTTKANVALLDAPDGENAFSTAGDAARRIAEHFGNRNMPLVVSNACISGVAAQVTAMRLLEAGNYATVIVAGCDEQSRFIVAGFQSFKALDPESCRPFDESRCGLNLGEASACMILQRRTLSTLPADTLLLLGGAIRNDANHISGPSRTGEGSYRALRAACGALPSTHIAAISLHGTGTAYNDEMEAIALHRAALSEIPACSLKGVFGHTMGAAGILETLLTARSVANGAVPATRGFRNSGVSRPMAVSGCEQPAKGGAVVKLLSGFGGCNGALTLCPSKEAGLLLPLLPARATATPALRIVRRVRLNADGRLQTDHTVRLFQERGRELLSAIYREKVGNYPKFYKMDALCRLGFIASELLLAEETDRFIEREDRAIALFGRSGSLDADNRFEATIRHAEHFFPSPAVFVYTLPNIVTGEIAIRNRYFGETSSFLMAERDEQLIRQTVNTLFADSATQSAVVAWAECPDEENFLADFALIERIPS